MHYAMCIWLQELRDSLWKARDDAVIAEKDSEKKLDTVQEQMRQSAASAKAEALLEAYTNHRALLRQLFPEVSVEGYDGKQEQWLEAFEGKAQEILSSRSEEVRVCSGKDWSPF